MIFFMIAPALIRIPLQLVLRYTLGWFFIPKDLLFEAMIILVLALILAVSHAILGPTGVIIAIVIILWKILG